MTENDLLLYQTEVLETLQALGEPERVARAKRNKKSQLNFLAIRSAAMTRAVKEGFSFYDRSSSEILEVWTYIWFQATTFEVTSAAAMYYSLQQEKIRPAAWPSLAGWSRRVDNWAHADHLASIYASLLPQVATCLNDDRFYVQKAVGWVLREMGHVYPAQITAFIEQHLGRFQSTAFSTAVKFLDEDRGAALKHKRRNGEFNATP